MTTETDAMIATTNRVVVVGMLDTMLVRERSDRRERRGAMVETTRRSGRTRGTGGRWENLRLQVGSPYGGMFALPIELAPDVPGLELLDSAAPEALLAVEGSVQLRQTFDARFASDRLDSRNRSDRGRPTRELQLRVLRVREPHAEERRTGSAVWLEGVIAEPPQVSRHAELPTVQLAGTILKVASARPLAFAGAVATIDEVVDVNVAVPTGHRDAEKLFQAGNRVRAVGQLDCRMEFQGGESVRAKLAELDAEWAAHKAGLVGQSTELRRAEGAYLRARQRFEAAPRLYVLIGQVDLLDGEPIALAETFELRRAFVRERRERRDARRQRVAAEQHERAEQASERDGQPERVTLADEVSPVTPRPRRRSVEAVALESTGVIEMMDG